MICTTFVNVTCCGLANLSTKESVAPGCRIVPGGIGLTYGFPSAVLPARLANVTVLGSPLTTANMGASTGAPDVFVRVTVESNVFVAGFRTGSGRVIANWPVMSFVMGRAELAGNTAHCPVADFAVLPPPAIEAFCWHVRFFPTTLKDTCVGPELLWSFRLPLTALATTAVAAELLSTSRLPPTELPAHEPGSADPI